MAVQKGTTATKTTVTTNTTSGRSAITKETVAKQERMKLPLFEKDNYMWMGIGAAVIALGMFLMAGGKNANPNEFDYNKVYSTTRITIAPILIMAGFVIEIYAIFKKPKTRLATNL